MNYTPSQAEAISARHENLLISAAAGSGKTRVLVDRIVDMLRTDHVPLKQMLIVTFTNAAAGEMKARLRQGLQEAVSEAKGDDKAFLLDQLDDLADAHISTMHAFCIAELRRFYHVLSLDPNFKVLPETTTTILREDALEQVMDAAYEAATPEFLELVDAYGGKSGDEQLRDLVRGLYFRIQSHACPLDWLEAEATSYRGPLPAVYTRLMQTLVSDTAETMERGMAEARRLADLLPNAEKCHTSLNDDESILNGLRKCLQSEDVIDAVLSYVAGVKWGRKPACPRNASVEEKELDDRYKALRDGYKEAFEALKKLSIEGGVERINADRALLAPHLGALAALVRDFDAAYRAEKKDKEGLDFNDLEHEMLRLLADDEARSAVREEIQYIFFDEYQDANPIQEAIVEALATDDHLFFVGDVKQAIYRFRRADPNIFNRRYARYRDTEDGRLIFLSENFRSRGEILNFSNALFDTLMTPALGDVDYREPGQALVCGGSFEADDEAVQCVAVIDDKEEEESKEALWIAEEIERLVASGRYDYGDMVVLMRSPRSRLRLFEEAFKRRHIPYYADNSVVGFHNLEVRLLIAMLTVLNNDELDHALLSALLSPFGGLTDEEIATVRLGQPEGAFAKACKHYLEEHEDAVATKLTHFYAKLKRWRGALRYEPLKDVTVQMVEESGYGTFLLGMDGGMERHQNVYSFIEIIGEYEKAHRYGLPGFLHYVKTLEDRSMDNAMPGIGLSENDRCVRIMSIHKSKGLGFKVVFLADMAHKFNMRDTSQTLVVDDDIGIAMKVVDRARSVQHPSFEKKLLAAKSKNDILSEEVRLLYVALTRAIDRLYLVSSVRGKAFESWEKKRGTAHATVAGLRGCHSYSEWLMTCLNDADHALFLGASTPLYRWRVIAPEEAVPEEETVGTPDYAALVARADSEQVAAIEARFAPDYPYQADTVMPFKKTVSELVKGEKIVPQRPMVEGKSDFAGEVPVPRFLQEHLSYTGAALGTLMHQVVQWLPLEPQPRADIETALDRLQAAAFLTAEERAAVDVDMLVGFYNSDFVKGINARALRLEHEVPFAMRVDRWLVDGQIDLFFETEEGYEIVDFKTDRTMDARRYQKQLDMYAHALSVARGKPVTHKWLYWLRHQVAEDV